MRVTPVTDVTSVIVPEWSGVVAHRWGQFTGVFALFSCDPLIDLRSQAFDRPIERLLAILGDQGQGPGGLCNTDVHQRFPAPTTTVDGRKFQAADVAGQGRLKD